MAYGAAEKGEEAPYRERRSLRALPVLIVGIGMLAMMAVATVVHMSNTSTTAAISLLTKDSQLAVSATAAGFGALGSVGKGDKNNILGSLGSLDTKLAHKQPVVEPMEGSFATGIVRMAEADAKRNLAKANKSTVSKLQEVKQIEQKELALQAQSKELRAEQVRVTEGLRKENVAYARAMAQAEAARSHAKTTLTRTVMAAKAPAVSGADASSVAKEVASMVMAAIQPELQAQQAEIAKLADAKEAQPKEAQPEEQKADFIAAKEKKVGAEQPEEKREHEPIKFDYHGQKLQPAFPEHFAKVQEERAQMKQPQMKAEKQQDSFQSELSRFMSQSRPFTHPPKKVQTLPKAEVCYVFLYVHFCSCVHSKRDVGNHVPYRKEHRMRITTQFCCCCQLSVCTRSGGRHSIFCGW